MEDYVVIIAGCRTFTDYEHVKNKLDHLFSKKRPASIVCGMANGVDSLGYKYAIENKIPIIQCWPNWEKYGKAAGMIRNKEMAKRADALVAFWDGKSPGTKNMIEEAHKRGLVVKID